MSEKGKHAMEQEKVEQKDEEVKKDTNEKVVENTDELIEIKKQNETLKIQLEETDDRLKRVAAEFDNYKKRTSKEKEAMYNSLIGDIVLKFLPVIDNLEKAVSSKNR